MPRFPEAPKSVLIRQETAPGQPGHGMSVLARLGFAHGDLSPYNILAHGERLVIIDLPQVVDLVANPFASDVLLRDCRTVCTWFTARGLDVDPDALFADLLAQAL